MKKNISMVFLGLISLLYLLNPTAGIFEFIPDNIPVLGNFDEAVAVTMLLAALKHFGIDLVEKFSKTTHEAETKKEVEKTVIEIKSQS